MAGSGHGWEHGNVHCALGERDVRHEPGIELRPHLSRTLLRQPLMGSSNQAAKMVQVIDCKIEQ